MSKAEPIGEPMRGHVRPGGTYDTESTGEHDARESFTPRTASMKNGHDSANGEVLTVPRRSEKPPMSPGAKGRVEAAGPTPRAPLSKVQRTVEILRILYNNDGLGLLRELAVAERRVAGLNGKGEIKVPAEVPRQIRKILEELGPTFVKIGQLLGTRPDLVPKAFIDEFKNLYDATTPNPYPEIRALVEAELGRPLNEVFLDFAETPIASASVGQVHFATLRTGERVAVKVQHPGIEERVFTDFAIMEPIVHFIENLFAASRIFQPRSHLLEVYDMLVKELDYRYEATNHQRVFDAFKDEPTVKIPRIHWEYSTKRVLCLERIEGFKLSDLDSPEIKALDGKRLARIITHAMARQIFEQRLFHADPSPGNLMAISSNEVAFLDFGAVGKITKRRSEKMLELIIGFVRSDADQIGAALFDICNVVGEVDMRAFRRGVERVMDYHERERASVADPVVMDMTVEIARAHNMVLPADFMLITRSLFQFEGLCKKLDPDFELVEVLEPYLVAYMRREAFKVENQKEVILDVAYQTADFLRNLPSRVNSLMRKIEQNEIRFKIDLPAQRELEANNERRAFRSTLTTLLGAIVVGLALVLGLGSTANIVPFLFGSGIVILLWAFIALYLSE